ncbi:hypothetical protein [Amycolatopsis nigrescens]|nr:hypothetical protein [Amycolatopsis nigrescens]
MERALGGYPLPATLRADQRPPSPDERTVPGAAVNTAHDPPGQA